MFLAKIKGYVVSTHKNQYLHGHKLMIVQPIDLEGEFTKAKESIALDVTDAGIGDIVLVVKEGAAVQQILGHKKAPVNTMIVAVVDDLEVTE